jgi:hypothetical protein
MKAVAGMGKISKITPGRNHGFPDYVLSTPLVAPSSNIKDHRFYDVAKYTHAERVSPVVVI